MKLLRRKPHPPPRPAVCTGTTWLGKPCKLPPRPGTDRCVFHPKM